MTLRYKAREIISQNSLKPGMTTNSLLRLSMVGPKVLPLIRESLGEKNVNIIIPKEDEEKVLAWIKAQGYLVDN